MSLTTIFVLFAVGLASGYFLKPIIVSVLGAFAAVFATYHLFAISAEEADSFFPGLISVLIAFHAVAFLVGMVIALLYVHRKKVGAAILRNVKSLTR